MTHVQLPALAADATGDLAADPHATGFGRLYASRAAGLARFFARRVGRHDAPDLVHDTFANMIGAAARESAAIERPDAYLSRVAGNLAARQARTAARRSFAAHVSADALDLPGPDPHAGLEARDLLDRLERTLLAMRPITREIFLAHRLDGYGYREIAARTGLSVKRVEKHM